MEGDVVICNVTTTMSFTTTITEGDQGVVGVVAESIADNDPGRVITSGYAPVVTMDGAATNGHFLKTSSTAKKATDVAVKDAECFGRIMETIGGAGPCECILWGALGGQTGATGGADIIELQVFS